MIRTSEIEKTYKILKRNELKGLKPSNIQELTQELGFSRMTFYFANKKGNKVPNFEIKLREWLKNN